MQFRNGNYLPFNQENQTFEPSKPFSPVYLLDLKIQYQYKFADFFVQVKNILDQEQQNIENVQLPGRWISGGINLSLNFGKKG